MIFESKAAPFFNTVMDFKPAGALIVAFTVTVDPGVPAKVPDVETVGIGNTSSYFWQLANATTTIANIASTLNMFVCKRFITFFVKMLIV
jgi:hypothetical protein